MRIFVMTDLEGVAGVNQLRRLVPCRRAGIMKTAKEFLTREVNAAVEGFLEGGATEIVVADGHGPGAMNISLLHPAAQLQARLGRGRPGRCS